LALPDTNARHRATHYTNGSSIAFNAQLPYTLAPHGVGARLSLAVPTAEIKNRAQTHPASIDNGLIHKYINGSSNDIRKSSLLDANRCFSDN
jgi:hypothetical protein